MFLLVLFPAGLHEEGIRGHLAPRLVGVSFTHGDRQRLPGGAKAGGWAPAGLGFPPKSAPARAPPFARPAARARLRRRSACSPRGPGDAAPGPNSSSPSRVSFRAITTSLPEVTSRRRRPPPTPGGGRERRGRPRNPSPDRNVPPASMLRAPLSCRLLTTLKKLPEPSPGKLPALHSPWLSPAHTPDSARRGVPREPQRPVKLES